jgi:hypothetical protein
LIDERRSEVPLGFREWCIVELLGHVRMAGFVTEEELFGAKLGRIDLPRADGTTATQFFGGGSIYRLTPTTEEIARAVAKQNEPEPAQRWELPKLKAPEGADGQPMERRGTCITCGRYRAVNEIGRCGECDDELDEDDRRAHEEEDDDGR